MLRESERARELLLAANLTFIIGAAGHARGIFANVAHHLDAVPREFHVAHVDDVRNSVQLDACKCCPRP